MTSHRISVKYFVETPSSIELETFVPIFQRWIQQRSVEGLLIDVADYKHVHEGPGILLVGHEADYSLDVARGRPGLLYTRKREMAGEVKDVLPALLRNALTACHLLQQEDVLAGAVGFRTDEVEITFLDRLQLPNQPESVGTVRSDIESVLKQVYESGDIGLERVHEDARQPLALSISVPSVPIETLLNRLGSSVPAAV